MTSKEHIEQKTLFQWAKLNADIYPELNNMFAIPNGGHRHIAVAKKLKSEGVKSGVPDIFLAYPRGKHHGLFIEMKAGRNKPSINQKRWLERLEKAGYKTGVCYSWDDARELIESYLNTYTKVS